MPKVNIEQVRINVFGFDVLIFKSKHGEISELPSWCAIELCYLYTSDSLCGLVYQMVTEWRDDKHLVG